MNIKRILALLFVVILVFTVFSGCTAKSVPTGIDEEGRFVYAIVRPAAEDDPEVMLAVKNLRATIKETFESDIYYIKDIATSADNNDYEILVGDTDREISAKVKQELISNRDNHAKDFIVKSVGKKIVIQAISKDVLSVAVDWFIKTFCTTKEDWAKLKSNYKFIYEYDEAVLNKTNLINGVNLGIYNVVLPRQIAYVASMGGETFRDYYNQYGFDVQIYDDFNVKDETDYELIIGDTTRKESTELKVEGDNYVIKVVGKKIVIKGGNDLATWRGVKEFLSHVMGSTEIQWNDGYTINGKYNADEKDAYTLNWNDEFEGNTLDVTKWGNYSNHSYTATGESSLGGTRYFVGAFEETAYKGAHNDLIYLSNGNLVLGSQFVNGKDFLNTEISTYYTMISRYGIYEVRMKFPENPACATYWINGALQSDMPERWGDEINRTAMTEIDIVENFGRKNNFASNIHRWWTEFDVNGKSKGSAHNSMDGVAAYNGKSTNNKRFWYDTEKYGDNLEDDFHIYTVYWDDSRMKFIFDGKTFCDYDYNDNNSVAVHCLMNYIILGNGVGAAGYGETYKPGEHSAYFEQHIDYVRVYQTGAINSQMVTAWPEKQKTGEHKVFYPENSYGADY